jgi:hypothetical protein
MAAEWVHHIVQYNLLEKLLWRSISSAPILPEVTPFLWGNFGLLRNAGLLEALVFTHSPRIQANQYLMPHGSHPKGEHFNIVASSVLGGAINGGL